MILPNAATLLIGTVVLAGGAVSAFHLSSNNGGIAAPAASASSTSPSTVNRRDFVAKSAAMAAVVALPRAGIAADDSAAADPYADFVTSESGMRYLITKEGGGAVPSAGQLVKVRPLTPISVFDVRVENLIFDYRSTINEYRRTTPAGSTGSNRPRNLIAPAIEGGRFSSRSVPDRSYVAGMRPSVL